MSGLVHEHGRLEPHSILSPEPMEADKCVGDVVGVTQAVDEPCCRVHHQLKTPEHVDTLVLCPLPSVILPVVANYILLGIVTY